MRTTPVVETVLPFLVAAGDSPQKNDYSHLIGGNPEGMEGKKETF
jgi:hypothetical protein